VKVDRCWVGASAGKGIYFLAATLALLAAAAILFSPTIHSPRLSANHSQSPLSVALNPSIAATQMKAQAVSMVAGLPLMFEPNQGQANLDPADPRARFIARGSGYSLFLGSQGATLALHSNKSGTSEALEMKFAGATSGLAPMGTDLLPGKSNYLLGNNPSRWRDNVPQFGRVRYENVYPGINLAFYGNQGHLEYDFQVAPGADASQAQLEFEGARRLELKDGALVIHAENGNLRLERPLIYQEIAGRREPVDGNFTLRGSNRVGFAMSSYDRSRELIIDPIVTFSSYFGGSNTEQNSQVAVDSAGNVYLAGSTNSPNLPVTPGVFQSTLTGTNVYIAKISLANPPAFLYVTYLGGSGTDTPVGVAVDAAGDAFLAGTTTSTDFPHSNTPYQSTPFPGSTGTKHVFVTELNPTATAPLIYSSYLSGNGDDIASGMTIDAAGNIFVTGTTTSNNTAGNGVQFPASTVPNELPFQAFSVGPTQFFVTKVDTQAPTTGSIAYSTYFGGGNFIAPLVANGGGIAVDSNGNIYFTGTTNFIFSGCAGCGNTDFPIKNAYQPCLNQGPPTTYVNPPVCTNTNTTSTDAFVAKLTPTGPQGTGQLQWSTYLGGSGNDSGAGVALDSGAANIFLVGTTNSTDVTTVATFGSFQPCLDAPTAVLGSCPNTSTNTDAFVARLSNPAGSTVTNGSLTYFTYLGGSNNEAGLAITVDAASGALVTGWTQSTDFPAFPAANNIQGNSGGGQDAFVARINTAATTGQGQVGSWASYFGGSGTDEGTSIAIDVSQRAYFAGDTDSTSSTLHVTSLQTENAGLVDAFVTQVSPASSLSITGILSLGTNQTFISAGSPATFTYTLTNSGPDLANNIVFTDDIRQTTTGVAVTFVSASITGGANGTCSGGSTLTSITCNLASLQSGSTATIQVVLTPTASAGGGAQTFNGGTVVASAANGVTSPSTSVSAQMSDFTVSVSPSSVSIPSAGSQAKYSIVLTPHPVFSTGISFSCSNLPSGAVCSFNPSTVNLLGSSPSSSVLTISTTARPATTGSLMHSMRTFYAVWLCVPGLALFGLGADRRRRRVLGIALLLFLSLLLLLQPACSHSTTQPPASGTPAGTFPITITATASGDSKSQGITLTVP
jgi:uncharacterized repeat protein (TIGR01451 family)